MTNDSTYNLFTVACSGHNPTVVLEMTMNNLPIQMELDIDTSLSLLNKTKSPTFSYNQQMLRRSLTDTEVSLGHS